ncbi:hypothetical protein AGLY_011346 [Aphis glycines]|uniref:Uncharacterized protein n=1 Tax=Aphis glycines TaxID=307491 RepID=A0A6G0TEI4_APHGL|nr:hypothetical protein AGLY_011346 [Aphis glycines]
MLTLFLLFRRFDQKCNNIGQMYLLTRLEFNGGLDDAGSLVKQCYITVSTPASDTYQVNLLGFQNEIYILLQSTTTLLSKKTAGPIHVLDNMFRDPTRVLDKICPDPIHAIIEIRTQLEYLHIQNFTYKSVKKKIFINMIEISDLMYRSISYSKSMMNWLYNLIFTTEMSVFVFFFKHLPSMPGKHTSALLNYKYNNLYNFTNHKLRLLSEYYVDYLRYQYSLSMNKPIRKEENQLS